MSDKTHISWSDATWNVVTGCTKVSAGCDHCYIERTPPFRMEGRRFDKPGIGGTTGVLLHPERLALPFKWRDPRLVFVNSLSDLFHDKVPDALIARLFAVMALNPKHTFQVLTKRPARMRSLLNSGAFTATVADSANLMSAGETGLPAAAQRKARAAYAAFPEAPGASLARVLPWPLPNVWLGVSAESQEWADRRVPLLLATPAAVRFVSAEPLLRSIDLWDAGGLNEPRLDWVICGGESGPGAQVMRAGWAEHLRDQCAAAGVAFHFKQYGAVAAKALGLTHRAGADPEEWPTEWPREYPAGVTA